jgi:hypothetical protein
MRLTFISASALARNQFDRSDATCGNVVVEVARLRLALASVGPCNRMPETRQCRGSEIRTIVAASPLCEFLNHKRHQNHKLASVLIESEVRSEGAAK